MQIKLATHQADFFKIVRIRTAVFVLEQHVDIQLEQDHLDDIALHWLVVDDQQDALACCRGLVVDSQVVQLGRVAVLKDYRNQHIGLFLLNRVHQECKRQGYLKVVVHAQSQVEGFYRSLGYLVTSQPFYEAGIEHVTMEKTL